MKDCTHFLDTEPDDLKSRECNAFFIKKKKRSAMQIWSSIKSVVHELVFLLQHDVQNDPV